MKAKDIREMTTEEIAQEIKDLKAELFNLRFRAVTGQLDNPMRIRQVRKDIARAMTIRRERELQIER
jgi:large subunit ribosomal protein L29